MNRVNPPPPPAGAAGTNRQPGFSIPKIRDTRGRESTTLTFVFISWLAVLIKFIIAGFTLPVLGDMPPMTAGEFGGATTAILAVWLGREWTEKRKPQEVSQ